MNFQINKPAVSLVALILLSALAYLFLHDESEFSEMSSRVQKLPDWTKNAVSRSTIGTLEIQVGMAMSEMLQGSPHIMDGAQVKAMDENFLRTKDKNIPKMMGMHKDLPIIYKYIIHSHSGDIELEGNKGPLVGFSTGETVYLSSEKKSGGSSQKLKVASQAAKTHGPLSGEFFLNKVRGSSSTRESQAKSSNIQRGNLGPQRTLVIPVSHPDAPAPSKERIQTLIFGNSPTSLNTTVKRWSQNKAWLVQVPTEPVRLSRCIGSETGGTLRTAIRSEEHTSEVQTCALPI
ncbi:MAG: hypothetical protein KDD25_06160 [Bdellovibrionales bacterium]|nr:hypothetical protein [Bdellovibrionales bacterium]